MRYWNNGKFRVYTRNKYGGDLTTVYDQGDGTQSQYFIRRSITFNEKQAFQVTSDEKHKVY